MMLCAVQEKTSPVLLHSPPGSCQVLTPRWLACPAEEVAQAQQQLASRRQVAEAEVVAALKGEFPFTWHPV